MLKHDEFIEAVEARALFKNTTDAEKTIRFVLELLGRRLARGEAADLAEELPPELRSFVLQSINAEGFGLEEFLTRLGVKEGISLSEAERRARAVLTVIAENISPGELDDILTELPEELRDLFRPKRAASVS